MQTLFATTNFPILQALPQRREDAKVLRNSLHNRLTQLRQSQIVSRREYEKSVQQAEQQQQLIFWQNQQSKILNIFMILNFFSITKKKNKLLQQSF